MYENWEKCSIYIQRQSQKMGHDWYFKIDLRLHEHWGEWQKTTIFYSPHLGIFKLIFRIVKVTVSDCTTGICLLCYKQITSIANFRERCSRANSLLKKQCKQDTNPVLERRDGNLEKECILLVDLGEDYNVIPSNSLWTKDANFGEISGELIVEFKI